ncbi:envelope glycoprotein precursor [Sesbania bispinosa]|nr:envelope glycoprotein precursor [Sesbania bispinosa]
MASENQKALVSKMATKAAAKAAAAKSGSLGSGVPKPEVHPHPPKKKQKVDENTSSNVIGTSPTTAKSSLGPKLSGSQADKGKVVDIKDAPPPPINMTKEELYGLLREQGELLFKNKTPKEMKDYLEKLTYWCLGGAIMVTFFKYVVDELHVLPDIKKNFEEVSVNCSPGDDEPMSPGVVNKEAEDDKADQLGRKSFKLKYPN